MKTITQVYEKTSSSLHSIYKKRRIANISKKVMWLVVGGWFLFMLINITYGISGKKLLGLDNYIPPTSPYYPYKNLIPFLFLMVLYYPSITLFSYFFKKYKEIEKSTIRAMVNTLFPDTDFTLDIQLPTHLVQKSNLFPWLKTDTVMYTYGQMKKRIEGVELHMADIGIIEKNASNKVIEGLAAIPGLNLLLIIYQFVLKNIFTSKSAENVYYTFRGLYCWARFNKKIKGRTVIIENSITSQMDRLASFNFREEEKVRLEDPEFAKYFTVYSTDQIEARYVLSLSLMNKIVTLKEKFNRPIILSFTQNNAYIAVSNPNGIFSFSSGKINSIEVINELFHEINTVQDVVTDFNLQHRYTSEVR